MRSFLHMVAVRATTLIRTAVLMLVLSSQSALGDPAPAGLTIRNIAQTTYFNTALGIVEKVLSNPVEALVAPVPNIEVTGYSDLLLTRGAMAQYYFDVHNTGNVPLKALLSVEDRTGATLISNTRLVPDLNGNGRIDPQEAQAVFNGTFSLLPGERVQLIYEFRVSLNAAPGDKMQSALVAVATPIGKEVPKTRLRDEAFGKATIVTGALELEKEQALRETDTETVLSFTLRARNNSEQDVPGYGSIGGDAIRIDGTARKGVLLRDKIPLNTVFHSMDEAGGLLALYHRRGDPAHDYRTTQPAAPREIDAVAFFLDGDYPVGRASDPVFSVRVPHELGDVTIKNTAEAFLGAGGSAVVLASNTTIYARQNAVPGTLRFEDPITAVDQPYGSLGSDTRLRLVSGACNLTPGVDTALITLRSVLTGDVETVPATEVSANTGVFLTPAVPLARMANPVSGDNVMATDKGDTLIATASCGGTTLEDDLLVDPGNFLFNSVTNAPIDGVTIALIDAATGAELARSVTDARGFFAFGDVPAGRYRYAVVGAPEWEFPSVRLDFPGFGRRMDKAGYGRVFRHGGGMLFISDIPVDPHYGAPLSLEKTVDRKRVMHGEFAIYTLSFTNNMHQALVGATLRDRPPFGAALVPGSVTLNGQPLADPVTDPAGDLIYDLDILEPLTSHELTYVLQFTAAAREGRNENTALLSGRQAGTGTPRQSPLARAMVRLDNSGGVFARQGTVIGSVFMDCDGDGIRSDATEPGIPGVRIVTQEGLSVVTDIDGQYSLFGLRPVTHAFLVQSETLPAGTAVTVTRTNDLRRGGSRLVPLKKGELRAEHFAVAACSPKALAEVAKRRAHFQDKRQPRSLSAADLPIEGQRAPTRSIRSEAGIATTTQLTPGMMADQAQDAAQAQDIAEQVAAAARRQPLAQLIKALDGAPGFVDLQDGDTVPRPTQNIRVKGKADLSLSLLVNGRKLGADRVGEKTSLEKSNVQALEYIAVKLSPGENRLTLVGRDGFGIERARHEIRVIAPGKPARFEIVMPKTASANPVSVVPVVVRVLDARGLPVPASGTVTLDARRALWDVTDIRPGTPGVQAYLDNGEASFGLIPPQVSGPDRITVTGPFGSAEGAITFTPDLEERILIGVIEGAVSLGGGGGAVLAPDRFSSFEDTTTGLRGELYLKGVIRGDALLTLRYSSDRDTEDRLFRDIRGDEYYPVYGDNSERGADAQSSQNLFVKVEKGRSYILYGDIAIEPDSSAFKLGGGRRVATGAKAHWENDKVSVTLFGARTAQQQRQAEIRGRGVSGPYDLDLDGYVQGTDRVEILVRDAQGGDILSATPMRRGTDYLLDFFRKTITFDAPVGQFDGDGNPISIRVSYEVEEGDAARYWLYGGEVNYALTDRTSVGLRAVHADAEKANPARERLQSGYIRHEDAAGGLWEAELARSEDAHGVDDTAGRLSYEYQSDTRRISIEAMQTGRHFLSDGGLARPGTRQARLSYGVKIDRDSDIALGVEYTGDRINDHARLSLDAIYSRQISDAFRGDIGVEYRRDQRAADSDTDLALILGGHWTPRDRPGTVIETELRYPLGGGDRPAELTLGMSREPKPGWRASSEVELRFDSDIFMARSKLGLSYALNDWLTGRTELNRGVADTDTVLNQAVSAQWDMNANTALRLDVEHARRMEIGEHEMTSFALGAKWGSSDGNWVGDADFDTTTEDSGHTYYASFGLAGQLTPDLTILGRSRIAVDQRNGENHRRMRTRAGVAYRPVDDPRLEMLAWYEHRLEEKHGRTQAQMWALDASYEVDRDLRLNGKYAGQVQKLKLPGGIAATATTQLVQAGLSYELADDRFQVGVNAAHLWDDSGNATSGLGAELGFAPAPGTLVAIGYNTASGKVAGQDELYQTGYYLRFDLLLDNSLWDKLDGFLGN